MSAQHHISPRKRAEGTTAAMLGCLLPIVTLANLVGR